MNKNNQHKPTKRTASRTSVTQGVTDASRTSTAQNTANASGSNARRDTAGNSQSTATQNAPTASRPATSRPTAQRATTQQRPATQRASVTVRPTFTSSIAQPGSFHATNAHNVSSHGTIAARQARKSSIPVILAIVALIALGIGAALLMSNWLNAPAKTTTQESQAYESQPYVSPYDFAGLAYDDTGRLTYSENGVLKSKTGVDVSQYQGTIDWDAVAGDGVSFALVRAGSRGYTEGALSVDDNFIENVDGATSAGLDVGVYFYSQALTVEEAEEEADLVIQQLNGRQLNLPVAFDYEQNSDPNARGNSIDSQTLTEVALAFCKRIEAAGYKTMIYGNAWDMARFNISDLGGRAIWFAEYNSTTPDAQFDFAIWQYNNNGTVAGIDAAVDMNILFVDGLT